MTWLIYKILKTEAKKEVIFIYLENLEILHVHLTKHLCGSSSVPINLLIDSKLVSILMIILKC